MAIHGSDIDAKYLQIRDIKIVRGDTFGFRIRMMNNRTPVVLSANSIVTFEVFDVGNNVIAKKQYTSENANQDTNGYINIALEPTVTNTFKSQGQYTYELEWLVNSSTIYTLLQGNVHVIPDKITNARRGT